MRKRNGIRNSIEYLVQSCQSWLHSHTHEIKLLSLTVSLTCRYCRNTDIEQVEQQQENKTCSGFSFIHAVYVWMHLRRLSCNSLSTVHIQELSNHGLLPLRPASGCHQHHVLWHLHSRHRRRLHRRALWSIQKWNWKPGSNGREQRTAGAKEWTVSSACQARAQGCIREEDRLRLCYDVTLLKSLFIEFRHLIMVFTEENKLFVFC